MQDSLDDTDLDSEEDDPLLTRQQIMYHTNEFYKEFVDKQIEFDSPSKKMGDWITSHVENGTWDNYFFPMVSMAHEVDWIPEAKVQLYDEDELTEREQRFIILWAKENDIDIIMHSSVCVLFKNKEDALLFRLKWIRGDETI